VSPTLASAQEFPPIKVDVQLVTLTATVEDSKGRAISGLKKEDFVVYEEHVRQEIEVFQSERVPVSLGVVFDTSGSMVDKIEEVEDAVIHFIETTNPEDEIFLVEFNFHASLVEDLTGDRQRLRRAVRRLGARGGTALYEAVVMGLQHLQRGRHKKKALLVITDGNDTTSQIGLQEAVSTTQQSEAIVYALGIGHGERGSFGHLPGLFKDTVDADILREFTDVTGGRTLVLEGEHHKNGVDLIDQACQQVSTELRNQYTLGYYPKNKARDGSYRRIKVEARNPDYAVRTREGYYAPRAN
jgi:Ca-activated chloride channel family protein